MSNKKYYPVKQREDIEWLNIWYSKANCPSNDRLLLLGDSTTRNLRGELESHISIAVDVFASSYCIDDPLFKNSFNMFIRDAQDSGYSYSTVVMQMTSHGRYARNDAADEMYNDDFGEGKSYYTDKDYDRYNREARELIKLMQHTWGGSIILMSSLMEVENGKEFVIRKNSLKSHIMRRLRYDGSVQVERNKVTRKKNCIIEIIAKEYKLPYIDVEALMQGTNIKRVDTIHYDADGNKIIVDEIMEMMKVRR